MTKLYSIRKNSALAAIFFASLLTTTAYAETEIDNEFWISTSTNTENLGTLDNPFDGSTATKFDSIMNSLPPNSTIHILAGTYQTYGGTGWQLKSGQKILGSGKDVTVLQMAPGASSGVVVWGMSSLCTNVEVADLTCDCHYTSGSVSYNGVEIDGTGTIVRGVKVINMASYDSNFSENWGISLDGEGIPNSAGNIIEDCEVSQWLGGGAISALSISLASGVVRDNHVVLTAAGGANQGINGSEATSVVIEGNYINGADNAVYGDTSGCTNIIIAHNQFINCVQGITYYGSQRRNITIADNVIDLSSNGAVAFNLWNVWDANVSITNVIITGNTVDVAPQVSRAPYVIAAANVTGLLCYGNTISGILASNQVLVGTNWFLGNKNVSFYNNYDLFGNLLTDFFQNPACTKSFDVLPPDAYVQRWGGATVTVGPVVNYPGHLSYGWNCPSNANVTLTKSIPLPNDFWGGKTTYIVSWKLWTTNAGTFVFNSGNACLFTNGTSEVDQQKPWFTAPNGTNITTISVTNTISTACIENLEAFIYTADKVQPGNYAILSGKVTAQ